MLLAPAAYAGDHGGSHYDPYAAARRAPVCTQAELSAGIDVDDCGRVLLRTAADGRRASRTDGGLNRRGATFFASPA